MPPSENPDLLAEPSFGAAQPASAPTARLTEILRALAQDQTRERVAIGDLLTLMQGRAFGALLIIFAFPNILPSPPGLAGILGLPLFFLSVQMILGQEPWLPQFIAKRSLPRAIILAMVEKIEPWLARIERLIKVRLTALSGGSAQRFLGLVCLILALALALPIPFANLAPATAICLIGLGILDRDGVLILIGLVSACAALVYVSALGYAVIKTLIFLALSIF